VVPGAVRNPGIHVPVIMIGPGTGVAPMRAILQERQWMAEQVVDKLGMDAMAGEGGGITGDVDGIAQTMLFFGCRRRQFDFLYGIEWEALSDLEDTSKIEAFTDGCHTATIAFSQDNPPNSAKTYVQHKIRKDGEKVWSLLNAGAHVLVAGSAKSMPADVRKALADTMQLHGGFSEEAAEKALKQMERQGKYRVDCWS